MSSRRDVCFSTRDVDMTLCAVAYHRRFDAIVLYPAKAILIAPPAGALKQVSMQLPVQEGWGAVGQNITRSALKVERRHRRSPAPSGFIGAGTRALRVT